MRRRRALRGRSALLVALPLAACDDAPSARLDLHLVADPKLNTVTQVLGQTQSIEVQLDSPDGLYPPGAESDDGTTAVLNLDADPALELVARVPVPDARFPRIRLLQGGLPDVALEVRIVGYGNPGTDAVFAEGTVGGVRMPRGSASIEVPFDLFPERRPPLVIDVDPLSTPSCEAPTVVVRFSRPLEPGSITGAGAILFSPGGPPLSLRVDADGRRAIIVPPEETLVDGRVRFDLTIATSAHTPDGIPLDQYPSVEGDQPFVGRFDQRCP